MTLSPLEALKQAIQKERQSADPVVPLAASLISYYAANKVKSALSAITDWDPMDHPRDPNTGEFVKAPTGYIWGKTKSAKFVIPSSKPNKTKAVSVSLLPGESLWSTKGGNYLVVSQGSDVFLVGNDSDGEISPPKPLPQKFSEYVDSVPNLTKLSENPGVLVPASDLSSAKAKLEAPETFAPTSTDDPVDVKIPDSGKKVSIPSPPALKQGKTKFTAKQLNSFFDLAETAVLAKDSDGKTVRSGDWVEIDGKPYLVKANPYEPKALVTVFGWVSTKQQASNVPHFDKFSKEDLKSAKLIADPTGAPHLPQGKTAPTSDSSLVKGKILSSTQGTANTSTAYKAHLLEHVGDSLGISDSKGNPVTSGDWVEVNGAPYRVFASPTPDKVAFAKWVSTKQKVSGNAYDYPSSVLEGATLIPDPTGSAYVPLPKTVEEEAKDFEAEVALGDTIAGIVKDAEEKKLSFSEAMEKISIARAQHSTKGLPLPEIDENYFFSEVAPNVSNGSELTLYANDSAGVHTVKVAKVSQYSWKVISDPTGFFPKTALGFQSSIKGSVLASFMGSVFWMESDSPDFLALDATPEQKDKARLLKLADSLFWTDYGHPDSKNPKFDSFGFYTNYLEAKHLRLAIGDIKNGTRILVKSSSLEKLKGFASYEYHAGEKAWKLDSKAPINEFDFPEHLTEQDLLSNLTQGGKLVTVGSWLLQTIYDPPAPGLPAGGLILDPGDRLFEKFGAGVPVYAVRYSSVGGAPGIQGHLSEIWERRDGALGGFEWRRVPSLTTDSGWVSTEDLGYLPSFGSMYVGGLNLSDIQYGYSPDTAVNAHTGVKSLWADPYGVVGKKTVWGSFFKPEVTGRKLDGDLLELRWGIFSKDPTVVPFPPGSRLFKTLDLGYDGYQGLNGTPVEFIVEEPNGNVTHYTPYTGSTPIPGGGHSEGFNHLFSEIEVKDALPSSNLSFSEEVWQKNYEKVVGGNLPTGTVLLFSLDGGLAKYRLNKEGNWVFSGSDHQATFPTQLDLATANPSSFKYLITSSDTAMVFGAPSDEPEFDPETPAYMVIRNPSHFVSSQGHFSVYALEGPGVWRDVTDPLGDPSDLVSYESLTKKSVYITWFGPLDRSAIFSGSSSSPLSGPPLAVLDDHFEFPAGTVVTGIPKVGKSGSVNAKHIQTYEGDGMWTTPQPYLKDGTLEFVTQFQSYPDFFDYSITMPDGFSDEEMDKNYSASFSNATMSNEIQTETLLSGGVVARFFASDATSTNPDHKLKLALPPGSKLYKVRDLTYSGTYAPKDAAFLALQDEATDNFVGYFQSGTFPDVQLYPVPMGNLLKQPAHWKMELAAWGPEVTPDKFVHPISGVSLDIGPGDEVWKHNSNHYGYVVVKADEPNPIHFFTQGGKAQKPKAEQKNLYSTYHKVSTWPSEEVSTKLPDSPKEAGKGVVSLLASPTLAEIAALPDSTFLSISAAGSTFLFRKGAVGWTLQSNSSTPPGENSFDLYYDSASVWELQKEIGAPFLTWSADEGIGFANYTGFLSADQKKPDIDLLFPDKDGNLTKLFKKRDGVWTNEKGNLVNLGAFNLQGFFFTTKGSDAQGIIPTVIATSSSLGWDLSSNDQDVLQNASAGAALTISDSYESYLYIKRDDGKWWPTTITGHAPFKPSSGYTTAPADEGVEVSSSWPFKTLGQNDPPQFHFVGAPGDTVSEPVLVHKVVAEQSNISNPPAPKAPKAPKSPKAPKVQQTTSVKFGDTEVKLAFGDLVAEIPWSGYPKDIAEDLHTESGEPPEWPIYMIYHRATTGHGGHAAHVTALDFNGQVLSANLYTGMGVADFKGQVAMYQGYVTHSRALAKLDEIQGLADASPFPVSIFESEKGSGNLTSQGHFYHRTLVEFYKRWVTNAGYELKGFKLGYHGKNISDSPQYLYDDSFLKPVISGPGWDEGSSFWHSHSLEGRLALIAALSDPSASFVKTITDSSNPVGQLLVQRGELEKTVRVYSLLSSAAAAAQFFIDPDNSPLSEAQAMDMVDKVEFFSKKKPKTFGGQFGVLGIELSSISTALLDCKGRWYFDKKLKEEGIDLSSITSGEMLKFSSENSGPGVFAALPENLQKRWVRVHLGDPSLNLFDKQELATAIKELEYKANVAVLVARLGKGGKTTLQPNASALQVTDPLPSRVDLKRSYTYYPLDNVKSTVTLWIDAAETQWFETTDGGTKPISLWEVRRRIAAMDSPDSGWAQSAVSSEPAYPSFSNAGLSTVSALLSKYGMTTDSVLAGLGSADPTASYAPLKADGVTIPVENLSYPAVVAAANALYAGDFVGISFLNGDQESMDSSAYTQSLEYMASSLSATPEGVAWLEGTSSQLPQVWLYSQGYKDSAVWSVSHPVEQIREIYKSLPPVAPEVPEVPVSMNVPHDLDVSPEAWAVANYSESTDLADFSKLLQGLGTSPISSSQFDQLTEKILGPGGLVTLSPSYPDLPTNLKTILSWAISQKSSDDPRVSKLAEDLVSAISYRISTGAFLKDSSFVLVPPGSSKKFLVPPGSEVWAKPGHLESLFVHKGDTSFSVVPSPAGDYKVVPYVGSHLPVPPEEYELQVTIPDKVTREDGIADLGTSPELWDLVSDLETGKINSLNSDQSMGRLDVLSALKVFTANKFRHKYPSLFAQQLMVPTDVLRGTLHALKAGDAESGVLEILNYKAAQGHYVGLKAKGLWEAGRPWSEYLPTALFSISNDEEATSGWPFSVVAAYADYYGIPMGEVSRHLVSLFQASAVDPESLIKLSDWEDLVLTKSGKSLGGMHSKWAYTDQFGNEWMGKFFTNDPNGQFRMDAEQAASEIGPLFGFRTPKAQVVTVTPSGKVIEGYLPDEGVPQYLQHLAPAKGDLSGKGPGDLTDGQLVDAMNEQLLDWLLSNHDTHPQNIMEAPDGRMFGIDKGQAFKFFPHDKLQVDWSPAGNHGRVWYYKFQRAIQNGSISKERADKIVREVLYRAQLISKSKDVQYRALLEEGLKNRTSWPPEFPTRAAFIDGLVERKLNLFDTFLDFYKGVYEKSPYEWDIAESSITPSQVGKSFTRPTQEYAEEVLKGGYQGVPLMFDSVDLEDAFILVSSAKTPAGKDVLSGEARVRPGGDAKFMHWLLQHTVDTSKAGDSATPVSVVLPDYQKMPRNTEWFTILVKGSKTVSFHNGQGDQDYNADTLSAMDKAISDIKAAQSEIQKWKAAHGSDSLLTGAAGPTLKTLGVDMKTKEQQDAWMQMLDKYLAYGEQVQAAKGTTTKITPHFQQFNYTPSEKAVKLAEEGLTDAPADLDEGVLVKVGTQAVKVSKEPNYLSNVSVDLQSGVQTYSGEGGSFGGMTSGDKYVITFEDGTKVEYRSHSDSSVPFSHQGLLSFRKEGWYGDPESIEETLDLLRQTGLDFTPATEESLQLLYWRSLTGVLGERSDSKKGAGGKYQPIWDYLSQSDYPNFDSPEEELEVLQDAWRTVIGDEKVDNAPWRPQLSQARPDSPDVWGAAPYWLRPDVTWEDLYGLVGDHTPSSNVEYGGTLEDLVAISLSGASLSSDARSRIYGLSTKTAKGSSLGDASKGSSAQIFTRPPGKEAQAGNQLVYHPRVLRRTTNFSYNHDGWGSFSQKGSSAYFDPKQLVGASVEMMIKHQISVFSDFLMVKFQSATDRQKVIDHYKSKGIHDIHGIPLTEFFVMGNDSAAVKKVVNKAWKDLIDEEKESEGDL